MSKMIQEIETAQMGKEVPVFNPGDTVIVHVKVVEGDRERLQAFEGVVIGRRNAGSNSSFTVRKISYGEGVERVFPLYSPLVAKALLKLHLGEAPWRCAPRQALLSAQPHR